MTEVSCKFSYFLIIPESTDNAFLDIDECQGQPCGTNAACTNILKDLSPVHV